MKYFFGVFIFVILFACKQENVPVTYQSIRGKTMGTTYQIILETNEPKEIKKGVDRLLYAINQGVSTYETFSVISLFNQDYEAYLEINKDSFYDFFLDNYQLSMEIYSHSNGAFEPTIMPIVNYWGFGYSGRKKIEKVDSLAVDSLMSFVGFEKILFENDKIQKVNASTELDFSGIAKGYGVDKVSSYLEEQEVGNYYVEIGGEVYAKGVNSDGVAWRTGVSVPSPDAEAGEFQQILEVAGKGIATSGNYRNFYESNGSIFSHTINPKTGFPERSNLLSATVIAPSCALADGYATACMVLGLERSIELINLQEEVEAILIYVDDQGELVVHETSKK